MKIAELKNRFQKPGQQSDALLAIAVVGLVCLLVIPLPPILLDAFLALSIVLSVLVLLLTLYIEDALEFSVFPSMLLFLTLYRLALNIASTRMILTRADGGDIIRTFGNFVTHGNPIVGLILFALLSAINFIVLSKGAGRIAEVSARFALEAMPGKQMSIDHDLQAGALTASEAKLARETLSSESEFYGAMDGASKFVRGDAICSLVITFINLIGGFVIGFVVKDYSLSKSWHTFTRLTIGDGLVNQLPALFISLGAAMMVTRASKVSLGRVMPLQLFTNPRPIFVSGCMTLVLCFVPGMPTLVLLPMALSLFYYVYYLSKKKPAKKQEVLETPTLDTGFVSLLTVELGLDLIGCADELKGQLPTIRRKFTKQLGVMLPKIQIVDNLELAKDHFSIKLKGATIHTAVARDASEMSELLFTIGKRHAAEFVTRQHVAQMIEKAKMVDSAVVEELVPARLKIGQVLKVLQNLLRENISIRDFMTVLESMADYLTDEKAVDLVLLTEHVRKSLFRNISESLFGKKRVAHAILLDASVQQMLDHSSNLKTLRPETIEKIALAVEQLHKQAIKKGKEAVVLTTLKSRIHLKRLLEEKLPQLPVVSYEELTNEIRVDTVGKVTNEVLI